MEIPGDLSARPPLREPDGPWWTVFATGDVEFGIMGDDSGPDPAGIEVARFVWSNWAELERLAEDVLNEVAADWDDYYARGEVPEGHRRYESDRTVTIGPTAAAFTVHCSDHRHNVNGWPYGSWMVDFRWATPVGVRVGTDNDNHYYKLKPDSI